MTNLSSQNSPLDASLRSGYVWAQTAVDKNPMGSRPTRTRRSVLYPGHLGPLRTHSIQMRLEPSFPFRYRDTKISIQKSSRTNTMQEWKENKCVQYQREHSSEMRQVGKIKRPPAKFDQQVNLIQHPWMGRLTRECLTTC